MLIKFDKMQSLGNDFVMIDLDQFSQNPFFDGNFFATISNRNYGIGCDLSVLYELRNGTIFTEFFNSNGSEAEICGNASRCLGLLMKKRSGLSKCTLNTVKRSYFIKMGDEIRVGMGRPSFDSEDIGFSKSGITSSVMDELDLAEDIAIRHAFCVSVGNPHLILFCENIPEEEKVISLGAQLENHSLFKNRINVSFAHVTSAGEIILSVFERGVGLTKACGSGACAAAAVAHTENIVSSRDVLVKQKGGSLMISFDEDGNIFQTGPAFHVFSGEIEI
jgi:diaminopimelate epimerase